MDKEKLHEELKRLHADLQQIESPANDDREILSTLAHDIQRILEDRGIDQEQYQGLNDRWKDAITRFEAAHPRVTLLMRQVLDQIAYLGI
ncbi:MAG TPA: DUF4404 family protein [Pyrinomonadaceae bacterium]|jgi:predicted nuclease with TOPRIM domain|nr:DUF4404 family protein [Pyrinomonadaceae bacterium]